MTTDLRYPIGKWTRNPNLDTAGRTAAIAEIAAVPDALRSAVAGLSEAQLDTPYREGGWSPRQIAHHIADSHMNAFTRFKLGLTEDAPTIKPYNEVKWAETADVRSVPVDVSLAIVEGVHRRLVTLLNSLDAQAFTRTIVHPENGTLTLTELLRLYAWHGRHHVTQISAMRARHGW